MSTTYQQLWGAFDSSTGALQGFAVVGGGTTPLVPGSTTLAGLTDIASYNLPLNNTPLATALAAIQTKFQFKTPATDNSVIGFTDQGLLAGTDLTRWNAVGINSSGQVVKASATNGILCLGLVIADVTSGSAAEFLSHGVARSSGWSWTPGLPVWLSVTTGGLTQTRPAATGNIQQPIGFARSATTILVNIGQAYNVTAL